MRVFAAAALGLAMTLPAAAQRQTPRPATPARPSPQAQPTAPRDAVVPFKVGEVLTYDVSWSQFITAGTAVARVVERKASGGSAVYTVVADGRPVPLVERFYKVYYKMETLLDSVSLLPQTTSLHAEESGKTRESSMKFDRRGRQVTTTYSEDPGRPDIVAAPANVTDGLATLYTMRGRAFRAGEHFSVPVADNGALYSVEVDVSGPERVSVPLGAMEAWNLKLAILDKDKNPAARDSAAWISTDARHLPLKLQTDLPVGKFVLLLRGAQ